MSSFHSELLPALALQLAVELERYRRVLRAPGVDHEHRAEEASQLLRMGNPLALALPVIWSEWGGMVAAHQRWVAADLLDGVVDPVGDLRRLQFAAEKVARCLFDWALEPAQCAGLDGRMAALFSHWEAARRAAFEAAMVPPPLRWGDAPPPAQRHATAAQLEADALFDEAAALLELQFPVPVPVLFG